MKKLSIGKNTSNRRAKWLVVIGHLAIFLLGIITAVYFIKLILCVC
jgi:hypothetical protein